MIQIRRGNMVLVNEAFRRQIALVGVLCVGLLVASSVAPVQAQNSDPSKQEKYTHYSLYHQNFENEEYEKARSDLLWILEHAPEIPGGDDRNFERAVKLYEGLAAQSEDPKLKQAYLDTAATHLTSAVPRMKKLGLEFSEVGWEVMKGNFVQRHQDNLPDVEGLKSPTVHFRRAFEAGPQEINPYYIRRVLQSYLEENDLQKAIEFANAVEEKRGDDEKVASIISSVRNQVFSMNPQARISYLEEQLEQSPDSMGLLTDLFEAYNEQGNVSKASKLAPRLMKMNPSAETVREIAKMRLEAGRPEAALKAYDRAANQGAELTAEDYFNRGSAYREMGQLPQARREFRKAIDMRSDFGEAYVAIGDLYTLAVNQCSGSEMSRRDRAVYWIAVDKYRRAKEVNPSISSTADSKIQTYRKVFPRKEDIHFESAWEIGGSFTIDYGCYSWIGETTTVRPSP